MHLRCTRGQNKALEALNGAQRHPKAAEGSRGQPRALFDPLVVVSALWDWER